jgi:hypothetical protein
MINLFKTGEIMNTKQTQKRVGWFKSILMEIRDSILIEIIGNILMYIPRLLFRIIKNIF